MIEPEWVYEYSASITFVFEYMTVNHRSYLELGEIVDYDTAEGYIIHNAEVFIKDYYGFSLIGCKPYEIYVDWEDFPESEDDDE